MGNSILHLENADKKVARFVNNYPYSSKKDRAYFNVGNYYFANKKAAYALLLKSLIA